MKILFVYPGIAGIGFNSYESGKTTKNLESIAVPLGISYLASAVEKEGFSADIVDLRQVKGYDQVEEIISRTDAEIIGLSVQTPSVDYARRVAAIAKKWRKIVVVGGIHATVKPDDFLKTGYVDYVITGEGEISLVELLQALKKGEKSDSLIKGKNVITMDSFPYAKDFSIYEERYKVFYDFEFSRGCPGKCIYCVTADGTMYGNKIKSRSMESILAGIDYYKNKYNFSSLVIIDDNAVAKRKKFVEFCKIVSSRYPKINLNLSSRVDSFTEEIAKAVSLFNGAMVWFGFESNSPKILKFLRKNIVPEQNYKAAKLCHKYNISIGANVLVGIPGETEEDIKMTCEFIQDIQPHLLYYNVLSPHPGTWITRYCEENNLIKPIESHDRYEHVEGLYKDGLIKGVDYKLVRKWMPKFYLGLHNYDPVVIGVILEKNEEFKKAQKEYEKAQRLTPGPAPLYYLGSLFKRRGNREKAMEFFCKMDEYERKSTERIYFGNRHFHRGEIYFQKGELEKSKKDFTECLQFLPDHKKAKWYLEEKW